MAVVAGTRFGPYEILSLIGAGGMGEVYRARDTRLNRTVAIKIVSDHWRDRPDLRARFRVEAEAIAALSHPHICQLHDIGQHGDVDFLVMELVDGETLAGRLARGRLSIAQALEYSTAIADALGHAHRRGIIHRDIKPANVSITRAGVKLLDFGLARFDERGDAPAIEVPTVAAANTRLTQTGATLGTWQYMAPEQLRGGRTDARSDVFALGAVMYEMFTRRRAFEAANHSDLVASILTSDPPALTETDPLIPAALEQVVRICLAKEPDERWQSGGDVRRALDTASLAIGARAGPPRPRTVARPVVIVAGLIVAAFVASVALWPRATAPAQSVIRSTLDLPPGYTVAVGSGGVAFAPDGTSVVYAGRPKDGRQQLYLRRLADGVDSPISGTENGDMPFFSPDGQWVGFASGGQLKKVPIGGGSPSFICAVRSYSGAYWGPDDRILFAHIPEAGIFRVPAGGGQPEPITTLSLEDQGNDHRHPQLLPGGRALLYAVATGPEDSARIVVADLRTGARKEVVRGAAAAKFVSPGQVVYARGGELFAVPFDVDRLETTGPPYRIATGVAEGTNGAPEYSLSATGDLVYIPGRSGGFQHRLVVVDFEGHSNRLNAPPMWFIRPRVSPDGRFIAYHIGAAKNNVWVFDREREVTARVTFGRFHEAIWTKDGRLTIAEGGPGAKRLVTVSVDGSGGSEPLTEMGPDIFPEAWAPHEQALIYRAIQPDGQWDLWSISAGKKQPLLTSPFNELNARFSPDGRWLAYTSDETGRPEIYVRSLDGKGGRWPVSTNGGLFAVWAPDGRAIYYWAPDGMWAVDVAAEPRFSVTRPRRLFSNVSGFSETFDIMPDGRRFVMIELDTTPPPNQINLVQNVFAPRRE